MSSASSVENALTPAELSEVLVEATARPLPIERIGPSASVVSAPLASQAVR